MCTNVSSESKKAVRKSNSQVQSRDLIHLLECSNKACTSHLAGGWGSETRTPPRPLQRVSSAPHCQLVREAPSRPNAAQRPLPGSRRCISPLPKVYRPACLSFLRGIGSNNTELPRSNHASIAPPAVIVAGRVGFQTSIVRLRVGMNANAP